MEVDTADIRDGSTISSSIPVNLWCFLGSEGQKKVKVDLDVNNLTLQSLKTFICQKIGTVSPSEIDILYNGGKLMDDANVKSAVFQPLNVITVLKQSPTNKKTPVDVTAASKNIIDQIPQIALALRTAFFNKNFIPTIEKLGDSDMLDNILAIATGLSDDPVGIAIIQDPAMIFHLSDVESLKKLAVTKPWVVEAFNFLAASVHQDKELGAAHRGMPSMFNPALFEGEDDDMDDGDEAEAGPSSRITREQLSAALNSLSALGRGALSSAAGSQPSGAGSQQPTPTFMDLLQQASAQLPSASGPSSLPQNSTAANTLNNSGALQNLLSAVLPSGSNSQVTPELVARAMSSALSSLPPGLREDRMNALRDQISRIQHPGAPSTGPANTAAIPSQNPASSNTQSSSEGEYHEQLSQMRGMGITDENLSILALRVSDGDVQMAVDLILSGWQGEGADSQMSGE